MIYMYHVNDYVVYRKDVCLVSGFKNINGNDYYILVPVSDKSLTITVPVSNSDNLRNLISVDSAYELIDSIPDISLIDISDDKFLEKTYKDLINSCDLKNYIRIIKTTYLRNQDRLNNKKKLSEKDNNYFELAERYLYNELSVVLGIDVCDVSSFIVNRIDGKKN